MSKMDRLLDELSRHHYPESPATLGDIEAFEHRVGWRLDPDLRTFYLHCNGARLFTPRNTPYRFLPLSEIVRGRLFLFGRDVDERGPESWYAICEVDDGNCIVVDVGNQVEGCYPVIDGFRDFYLEPGACRQIERCFADFLERAMGSKGQYYWLDR